MSRRSGYFCAWRILTVVAASAGAACDVDWSASPADAGMSHDPITMDAAAADGGLQPDQDASSASGDAAAGDANVGPTCDGEWVACDGVCADLTQSAEHCGRCGRACQSGVCEQGACTPFVVRDQSNPDGGAGTVIPAFAVAGPFLYYFTGEGSTMIERVPVTGGDPMLVTYSAPPSAVVLTADPDGYLYAAHGESESSAPTTVSRMKTLTSDQFMPLPGGQSGTYIMSLTTNATHVAIVSALSRCYVQSLPKTGGTEFKMLASGPSMCEVEVDASHAYIRDEGAIVRTSVTEGGDAELVAAFDSGETSSDIALGGDSVVFASSTRVGIVAKAGGTATPLAGRSAYAVLANDTHAYYLHARDDAAQCTAGTEVYSVALDGSGEHLLATEACAGTECCLAGWTQSADALYVRTSDRLQIHRIEK